MFKLGKMQLDKKKATISVLRTHRLPFWKHWRTLSDLYLPRRYMNLLSPAELANRVIQNSHILDSTGTIAARTLASGMMNGITSPSRVWFKYRMTRFIDNEPKVVRVWLDEVERRIAIIMSESNFYNSMATVYLDLSVFGTAAMIIYEDDESVIRCYNPPLGEYYLTQSFRQEVNGVAREISLKVHQLVSQFGFDNCSPRVQDAYKAGGSRLQEIIAISHLIEPNLPKSKEISNKFNYREYYWESAASDDEGKILLIKGFNELPGIFPRWDMVGNDAYGGSPGMDALGDVLQLQQETKVKGQALDKMVNPPLEVDSSMQHKPISTMARGLTFTSGLRNSTGGSIRPAYQVQAPLGEMTQDIAQLQARIREIFHNDLFRMIAQLDTVRSATEIDARREEKLVLLGPVLERFENEALDPGHNRIFSIANRAGLIPPPPPGFENEQIEIQYVSVLAAAQRAVGTAATERLLNVTGAVVGVHPEARHVPNIIELMTEYARNIGVSAKGINSPEEIQLKIDQDKQQEALANEAAIGADLAKGAQNLANADVGGGINALQAITGGG